MKSNYKKLGDFIVAVNNRNVNSLINDLRGLSLTKEFRVTTSNIIGTDMSTYKIMQKYDFAANFMGLGVLVNKVAIVLKKDDKPNIVSGAYPVFKIKDTQKLHPEYLMMWFKRSEFDRYCVFKSDKGIRGGFDWADLCDSYLPIPSIDKQEEIVKEYNVIQNRIALNKQLIAKLEKTAQTIYKQWFVDFEFPDANGKPYKSNGGAMEWCAELEKDVPYGWSIKKLKDITNKIGSGSTPKGGKESYFSTGISLIRSMNVYDLAFLFKDLAFINELQADKLKNVEVFKNDVLFNITGVSVARCCIVPENVLPARVNQHVMIIRAKDHLSYFILMTLCYSENKNKLLGISQSGSTREAITKSEIEDFKTLLTDKQVMIKFDNLMKKIFDRTNLISNENQKLEELNELLLARMTNVESEIATVEN